MKRTLALTTAIKHQTATIAATYFQPALEGGRHAPRGDGQSQFHEKVAVRRTPSTIQRGAAYLEFAFVLPFFLVFVMGIVEFGRGFNIFHNLTNACREGARQAAVQDSNQITLTSANNIRNRVVSYMNSLGLQTTYYTGTGAKNPSTSTNYVYGSYPNGAYMLINQGETIPQRDASGTVIAGGNYYLVSKVELRYPYSFPMFSRVIRLLLPSSAFDGTIYIGNSATMEN